MTLRDPGPPPRALDRTRADGLMQRVLRPTRNRNQSSRAIGLAVAIAALAGACGQSSIMLGPSSSADPHPTSAALSSAPGQASQPGASTAAATRGVLPSGPVLVPQAYASRVVIPSLKIDLPIVSGDLRPPPNYPFCDVALYVTRFNQPDAPGVTYLTAHAQTGMFLPMLEASRQNDGGSMLGAEVDVYTTAAIRFRYTITKVIRHAIDYGIVGELDLSQRNLILQTSEGPPGTPGKLQVLAAPLDEGAPVDAAVAVPEPKPRDCDPK